MNSIVTRFDEKILKNLKSFDQLCRYVLNYSLNISEVSLPSLYEVPIMLFFKSLGCKLQSTVL